MQEIKTMQFEYYNVSPVPCGDEKQKKSLLLSVFSHINYSRAEKEFE